MDMFTPQCASLPAKICLRLQFLGSEFLNSSKLVVTTHHLQGVSISNLEKCTLSLPKQENHPLKM